MRLKLIMTITHEAVPLYIWGIKSWKVKQLAAGRAASKYQSQTFRTPSSPPTFICGLFIKTIPKQSHESRCCPSDGLQKTALIPRCVHPDVHSSTIHDTETAWEPLSRAAGEEGAARVCGGAPLSHTEEWKSDACATQMDWEISTLSEVSQKEQDTYHSHAESKTWNERTYLHNRNRLTETDSQT